VGNSLCLDAIGKWISKHRLLEATSPIVQCNYGVIQTGLEKMNHLQKGN